MTFTYSLFKINPDERSKAVCISAMFMLIGFYNTIIESTSLSVFDIRLGTGYFPVLYMLFPFFNLLISSAFLMLLRKVSRHKLFRYFLVSLAGLHLFNLVIILDVFSSKYWYGCLMLSSMLAVENLIFLSMLILHDFVSIESIKRLLPLATASITAGAVLGALAIRGLSPLISSWVLFLAVILILPLVIYLADLILKRYRIIKEISSAAKESNIRASLDYIKSNPFFIVVMIISTVVVFSYTANNYFFNFLASKAFTDERELFSFLGRTQAYQYAIALAAGAFILSRLITKLGAPDMAKVVLGNLVISMLLMLAGTHSVILLMASRIISREFMLEINYLLVQVFYHPANPRYKDNIFTIHNIIVNSLGCILGGAFTILHSKGIAGHFEVVAIILAAAVASAVLWQFSQRGFVAVIEKTMSFAGGIWKLDIGSMAAEMGEGRLWDYISAKVDAGQTSDMVFALELAKALQKEKRQVIVAQIYKQGGAEVKLRAVDMFLEGQVSWDCLESYAEEMDDVIINYLVNNLARNFNRISGEDTKKIKASLVHCDKEKLEPLTQRVYEYLLNGRRETYEQILQQLWARGNEDDLKRLLEIMESFIGVEDEINRKYLCMLTEGILGHRSLIAGTVKLCAYFDRMEMGTGFFRNCILKSTDYKLIEKTVEEYGEQYLKDGLSGNGGLLQQLYMLYLVRGLEFEEIKKSYPVYEIVLCRLEALLHEKRRIEKAAGTGRKMLLEELEQLGRAAEAIIFEYLYLANGFTPAESLYIHLNNEGRRAMVMEVMTNSLPKNELLKLKNLIMGNGKNNESDCSFNIDEIGQGPEILVNIYKVFNGFGAEPAFHQLIERLDVLKQVPMFSELNFDMLYNLNRVSKVLDFGKGDTAVRKGEPGDSFYIVLEGELGVYISETAPAIAILKKGDILGELAVLDKGFRTATVTCSTEVRLLEFRGDDFIRLLENNGTVAVTVLCTLSRRLAEMAVIL